MKDQPNNAPGRSGPAVVATRDDAIEMEAGDDLGS